MFGPPTKKQVECADRLSRGYSVEAINFNEKPGRKKSLILHNDDICEEENPCYHMMNPARQSRELPKETRKHAEKKLRGRLPKGTAVKQQLFTLDFEIP